MRFPQQFLNNKYIKFAGWMLSDIDPAVRLEAATVLTSVYDSVRHTPRKVMSPSLLYASDSSLIGWLCLSAGGYAAQLSDDDDKLDLFHKRFVPKMVNLVADVDEPTAVQGCALLTAVIRSAYAVPCFDKESTHRLTVSSCPLPSGALRSRRTTFSPSRRSSLSAPCAGAEPWPSS